jgi:SAM-dependent methyltransferase
MPDIERFDPTGRFSGLADIYAKNRPGYPDAAMDYIIGRSGLNSTSRLIDVGCGTGISTRLFTARGIPVIGVEPNDAMRAKAEAEPMAPGQQVPTYLKGTAEATGLADGFADAVIAAQAFHWFKAEASLHEFHRVLRIGGHLALMWNERDESHDCTAAYGSVMRWSREAASLEASRADAGGVLMDHPLFVDATRVAFPHDQELDVDRFVGRALSASYAPREPAAVAEFVAAMRQVHKRFEKAGKAVLRYQTSVYLGRRKD